MARRDDCRPNQVVIGGARSAPAPPYKSMILTGHLSTSDKARSDYAYIPFDVPAGIVRLDIRYSISHPRDAADLRGEGNTIDIGIFDPRGHEFGTGRGFRGWSGSDRDRFFIAEDAATPGYLAGPIQPGEWHVIFGLYHLAEEGCDYQLEIEFTPGPSTLTAADPPTLPGFQPALNDTPGWVRGDLQCHTQHSDAEGALDTLLSTARTRGLDFLAVTDHNTVSHIHEFPAQAGQRPLLIPATEVTTYAGHMNVWGLRAWQEFRCSAADRVAMRAIIDLAHAQGGLCSVNHPKTDGPPWEYGDLPYDCVEAWQAPWPFRNEESLAFWDALLMAGRRVIAVGGSDYHQPLLPMQGRPHLLGQPTTWVYADALSVEGVLAGLRRGHACVSADIDGARLDLRVFDGANWREMGDTARPPTGEISVTCQVWDGAGGVLRLIADGAVIAEAPVDADDWRREWPRIASPARYLRAELIRRNPLIGGWMMLALGNPVFIRRGGSRWAPP